MQKNYVNIDTLFDLEKQNCMNQDNKLYSFYCKNHHFITHEIFKNNDAKYPFHSFFLNSIYKTYANHIEYFGQQNLNSIYKQLDCIKMKKEIFLEFISEYDDWKNTFDIFRKQIYTSVILPFFSFHRIYSPFLFLSIFLHIMYDLCYSFKNHNIDIIDIKPEKYKAPFFIKKEKIMDFPWLTEKDKNIILADYNINFL